jgi:hypothetical protein
MRLPLTIASGLLGTMLWTSSAMADASATGGRGVDWGRVVSDVDALARRGADVLDSPRCSRAGCLTDTNATAAPPERAAVPHTSDSATSWFGFAPRTQLVARDWGSSIRVSGDRLALVDTLRLTTSTRMVLARVRLTDARVAPFVQVGVGQWRTDPYILPLTPRFEELAAQSAAGVEVRVRGSWTVGLEQSATVLHRERGSDTSISGKMWSTTLASRIDF